MCASLGEHWVIPALVGFTQKPYKAYNYDFSYPNQQPYKAFNNDFSYPNQQPNKAFNHDFF